MNADARIDVSLRAETHLLDCVRRLSEEMKANGDLTRGTDDLLAGIEDKHEEHFYLLRQRASKDAWKA
jgi:hypothetical protein